MGEAISVSELARDLGTLKVTVEGLKTTQRLNHKQNRDDIHSIRNILQMLVDKFQTFEIKNAKWNVLAGVATAVVTALILKGVDRLIK